MSSSVPITVRPLTRADIPSADELRALAGWNQTIADWERILALDPSGSFAAEVEGRLLGTTTTLLHEGGVAWIGMVLVHPDWRKRGIGKALLVRALARLEAVGAACIKLDATPAGKPLYDGLGFRVQWTLSRWERGPASLLQGLVGKRVRAMEPCDREAVAALDRAAFGVSRGPLFLELERRGNRMLVHESDGGVTGFGMVRAGARAAQLGPVVARTAEAGRALVTELLSKRASERVFWDIPDPNLDAVLIAKALGFHPVRPLTRMVQGEERSPGDPALELAPADLAHG
ncbi:MAG TPA: GNAT family N-acetyltransferase [Planctomycetota bacterium]|nr:GNAT family N-acetyltransferase [Planctomycetota bacterium]